MSDNHQILKLFTRKLANCRYKVPVKSVIQYMDKGQFGYHIVEGEDTVVTNDSVFASSIASVITHIRAIFKDPHIFLKQEEIIQNIAVASHINNETLRMNYKDSKLWKTKALDTSPEFVHTFVYEDDYAIYENRFISFLMDELLKVLGKKISKIQEGIETFNWNITHRTDVLGLPGDAYLNYAEAEGGVPVIMATADVRVSVLESLLKSKKNLIALMQTPIYKACKKAGTFNELGLKLTNILLHDKHYNYCYEFYLNYLKRDAEFTSPSNMFNGFAVVNMICALNRIGFACENPDEEILISNSARVKFEKITFIREPFQIDMALGDKSDFSITVKNLVSGSSIQHFIKVVHTSCDELKEGATVEEIFQQYKAEANLEDRRAWLITDVEVSGEGVLHIQPANGNVIDLFAELLKKFTLLAEGSLSIYTSICPVCGSKFVSPDDKDYFCVDCDSVYHLFYYATRDLIWVKRLPKITDAFEVEKPVVEEIVEDEAVKEEPVVEEVVANETAKEEPVVEDVVAVTPVVEEAAAEEKTEKLVIEEVEIEEIFDEPAVEEKPVMDIDEILSNEAFASYIKRHFFAKVSHLEEEKKGYYNELKNYILQYKKISARASWNYETFSAHREARIRLAVRGKTLVAFFALDYKQYEDSKYFPKYMGDTKKYEDTPMMVKVQSSRGVKFAKELIDIVLADLEKNENYEAVDYTIPYKSDKQLYEEGLIKIVGNVSLSDYVREEAVKAEAVIEEVVVEEVAAEETVVETPAVEETAVADVDAILGNEAFASYIKRHFFAKVSHLEEEKKGYYNELKNYILQYKKISARASWNYETFSAHREARIRLAVRGKTLVAFFALDYKQYEDSKYFPKYMGDTKKYEDTPMMVKVQSSRGVKFAKELIDIVLADLEKNENYEAVDYTIPYKSDKQLYEEGLIKIVGNVSLSDGVRAEAVTAEAAIEEVVEETVKEEVVVEKVVEEVAVAKAEENAPKRHILGTITRHRTIKHIRK